MAAKFYKKTEPKNQPRLGNGTLCDFTTLDGITGYFATDNPYVQGEFDHFIREGRYGLKEIEWAEFEEDYVKKKGTALPLRPRWREEITGRGIRQISQVAQKQSAAPGLGAAAVGDTLVKRVLPTVTVSDPPASEPAKAAPKPRLGKRTPKPGTIPSP